MTDERWRITRSKIVMRDDEEPRVVAAGSAVAMESLWLEMIEREDEFYLTLEPVPTPEKERLEYLRRQIDAECISYGELAELADLAEHIEPGDVQLLEWAGVPEFPDNDDAKE